MGFSEMSRKKKMLVNFQIKPSETDNLVPGLSASMETVKKARLGVYRENRAYAQIFHRLERLYGHYGGNQGVRQMGTG